MFYEIFFIFISDNFLYDILKNLIFRLLNINRDKMANKSVECVFRYIIFIMIKKSFCMNVRCRRILF